MARPSLRFIGVDLGGGRGKTTAVAELRATPDGVEVLEVASRANKQPWTDETLIQRLIEARDAAIAIDAPLTRPSCGRCDRPVCPGMEACEEPAVVWLRTEGRALVRKVAEAASGDRIRTVNQVAQVQLAPYAHRATEVDVVYRRGLLPIQALGASNHAIAARAGHVRRRLRGAGFVLHHNLIEVSPAATIAALCGVRASRGYKRDADPWRTRAMILERLGDLTFAPRSRMAREDVLQNDHCFDALISAYTAYRWSHDRWPSPTDDEDGQIVVPPP